MVPIAAPSSRGRLFSPALVRAVLRCAYKCRGKHLPSYSIILLDWHAQRYGVQADADGVVAQQLAKNCGFHQWPGLSCTSESYLSLPGDLAVRKEQLVYLTADSPTEIDVIEPGLVYILGGIVDRNRYPALTYNLAVAQGVKTARLPLTENGVQLLHGTSVLTVNHMLDILLFATQAVGALAGDLATAEGDEKASVTSATALAGAGKVDWRAALLAALPSRKGVVETVNPSSATLP